mgnify:FL=1|tara:strand:- start:567 stop:1031 length:465 start_codon:yes stop_codon:yes gene_type:complete
MKLSNNFSLKELTKSQTATRRGINNVPGGLEEANLQQLCEHVLQRVRDHFGKPVTVTSGYRSPELNEAIGGSVTSDHCQGMAADIEIAGVSNYEVAEWIKENCMFKQLILEFYTPGIPDSGWVHVSYDYEENERKVMTAMKENGRTVYKVGLIA